MVVFEIRVHGTPAAQGSKVLTKYGAMRETSKKLAPWRDAVRSETQSVVPEDAHLFKGPVEIHVTFFFARPKGHFGTGRKEGTIRESAPSYPVTSIDIDKACRSSLDALVQGGAFFDDKQVCDLHAVKKWATEQDPPGAFFRVTLL